MKRSTEWFISGAFVFGMAFFLYLVKVDVERRAFWFGTGDIPPIQVAIMRLSPIMIPALIVFGIISLAMGLSKAGVITVETETTTPEGQKKIIKEVVMLPCDYCKALIPQASTFCPECGARRKG